jgi:hypothetical protein
MGNGFYLDTDAYYTADGGSLKIQDIGPNISFVNGGSHNTLIVATNDGLIAVEAPGDDGQSKIVMVSRSRNIPASHGNTCCSTSTLHGDGTFEPTVPAQPKAGTRRSQFFA